MRVWEANSTSNSGSPRCKLWVLQGNLPAYARLPRLGINRKVGDLMRLAGACINDGVCGLIRQYT